MTGNAGPKAGVTPHNMTTDRTRKVLMDTLPNGKILVLRSAAQDRAEVRARGAVYDLAGQAQVAIAAVLDGDIDAIFTAHRLVNKAMKTTLDHRLSTAWNWRPSA